MPETVRLLCVSAAPLQACSPPTPTWIQVGFGDQPFLPGDVTGPDPLQRGELQRGVGPPSHQQSVAPWSLPLTLKLYAVPDEGQRYKRLGLGQGGQQVLGSLGNPSSIKLRSAEPASIHKGWSWKGSLRAFSHPPLRAERSAQET